MKYIENPALSRLADSLTHEGPECSVHTRMEAYSCKNIKRDKKLFKALEHAYQDEISNSPPLPSWLALEQEAEMTPFGPIDKHASRKTLYLLIATLNIAFPDHEFSDVRPSHFNKEESGASVLNALSNTLIAPHRSGVAAPRTYSFYPPTSPDFFPSSVPTSSSPYNQIIHSPFTPPPIVTGTHPSLFKLVDDVIGLSDCEVYSYTPEIDADPHANDFSDDEEDIVSDEEGESSTDEDVTFEFDNYDIDEVSPERGKSIRSTGPAYIPRSFSRATRGYQEGDDDFLDSVAHSPLKRRRGALLWSSHWFFLNRKLKRILYISVWAHSRGMGRIWDSDRYDLGYHFSEDDRTLKSERFHAWEGAVGAGARAMGLKASSM
ncbi:hypothetical protein AX16_001915 [Volvariella volvacea WC 439]|nr:hypothetical protein AX16_001915 [Volvariella volvacea WC 439]